MMQLGMITPSDVDGISKAIGFGLKWVEFCVNVGHDIDAFVERLPSIKDLCALRGVNVGSIGRWGAIRLSKEGIIEEELKIEYRLIDCAYELGCPVYVTNCNYVEELSFDQNCDMATEYLSRLCNYAKEKNILVCTYNCPWNSFICSEETWSKIHTKIPELGIKFDPSHSIAGGRDYLDELNKWGERVYHVHLKGSLYAAGCRVDDPPAGLDCTNWPALMAMLYTKGYDRMLSIEPHSPIWKGKLGDNGVSYSVDYFKRLIF